MNITSLTRIELAFGLIIAASAAGLMLALGFKDRKRGFAILAAIGAKPEQLGAFLWAEGALVILGGSSLGLISGIVTAWMLVKLLTGVFDPPPEALSMPWAYLSVLIARVAASVVLAIFVSQTSSRKDAVGVLRDI